MVEVKGISTLIKGPSGFISTLKYSTQTWPLSEVEKSHNNKRMTFSLTEKPCPYTRTRLGLKQPKPEVVLFSK